MKVLWTETAAAHLAAIHEYITKTSPVYAQVMVRRLWDRITQLRTFPELGPVVPDSEPEGIRELLESPYRILYRLRQDRVEILAIVHARRRELGIDESGRAT